MRWVLLGAMLLAGCGGAGGVGEPLPVRPFLEYRSEVALAVADAQADADLAFELLAREGLVAHGGAAAFAGGVTVVRVARDEVQADTLGVYFADDALIVLNASGESLLHELLHHYAAAELGEHDDPEHRGWATRGWHALSAEFKARR